MKNSHTPKSRQENLLIQDLINEKLIYDLEINRAFSLNETMSLVWQECSGKKTVSEISESIGKKLNSQIPDDFVWTALEQLKAENLLLDEGLENLSFALSTRREVIKKAGIAAAVALPAIISLTAPKAVDAQSGPIVFT